jgi:hypothetical protein
MAYADKDHFVFSALFFQLLTAPSQSTSGETFNFREKLIDTLLDFGKLHFWILRTNESNHFGRIHARRREIGFKIHAGKLGHMEQSLAILPSREAQPEPILLTVKVSQLFRLPY